jgi:hypothetical protein
MHYLVNYTEDQAGLDMREEDVVRPVNRKWTNRYGKEQKSWRKKSNGHCQTYGSCQNCFKSGPVGKYCNECYLPNARIQPGYVMLVSSDYMAMLDSVTIAEMLNRPHDTAKRDRVRKRGTEKMEVCGTEEIRRVTRRLEVDSSKVDREGKVKENTLAFQEFMAGQEEHRKANY